MRCFICLAETLSFTETAARLFMTQQAVSKHIAQLEEELGFPLLLRSKHGVTLTQEGKQCYMIFTDFIRNYDDFRANAMAEAAERPQSIHIGFQNWLDYGTSQNNILSALQKLMPTLEIISETHSPGTLNRLLKEGILDVALIQKRFLLSGGRPKAVELSHCPMVLFISASLEVSDEEVRTLPLIIDSFDFESQEETLARANREIHHCGLAPKGIIIMPNRDSVYSAVEMGQGVTTGTVISQAVQNPLLRTCPTDSQESLLCLWREDNDSPAIRSYIKCAKREYRSGSASDGRQ